MSALEDLQRSFAAAVFDAEAEIPATLTRKSGGVPHRRFAVYRNNTYASLIEVLEGRYPVVGRLVGEEFFRAMAAVHIERHPPQSPVLLLYGAAFPAFVAGFPPAAGLPYLADVAALEWAWHEAYHAEDAKPLPLTALGNAAGDVAQAVLILHPSLRLASSPHPVLTIWERHGAGGDSGAIAFDGKGEDALIVRPNLDVQVRRLRPGAVPFIRALGQGRSLLQACELAAQQTGGFDLQVNLAGLMASGAIVAISPKGAAAHSSEPSGVVSAVCADIE
jgi:hypothetical protein